MIMQIIPECVNQVNGVLTGSTSLGVSWFKNCKEEEWPSASTMNSLQIKQYDDGKQGRKKKGDHTQIMQSNESINSS